MKLIENDFDKVYDELSQITEASEVKYFLSTFTGFDNGKPIENTDDVLLNYVNIDKSIESFPDLSDIEPNKWPVYGKYWFKCPRCGAEYTSSIYNLQSKVSDYRRRSERYNLVIPAARFAWCGKCGYSDKIEKDTGEAKKSWSISDIPKLWDSIPNAIINKETGILTDFGRQEIYRLNKDNISSKHGVSQKVFDLLCNTEIDIRPIITKYSELLIPLICPDCKTSYSTSVANAYSKINKNMGCPNCALLNGGRQDSDSELLLKDALDSIEAFSLFDYTPKGFKKVDICLTYNGNKYAIEYDSKNTHNTEASLNTDIRKTEALQQTGFIVIRVRDKLSIEFPNNVADVIILPTNSCFDYLGYVAYKNTMIELCNYIGYSLTEKDIKNITDAFINRSSAKAAKRARLNKKIN